MSAEKERLEMQTVMVYRVLDDRTMKREPIGILVERRKAERGDNFTGMLRLARKEYEGEVGDPARIVISDYV